MHNPKLCLLSPLPEFLLAIEFSLEVGVGVAGWETGKATYTAFSPVIYLTV